MNVPRLDCPERYRGLYVFDYGPWSAVGYTAEEIAILLESEAYRAGQVYKIHRAYPDGRLELRGVSRERFQKESGLFFHRGELGQARSDFQQLVAAAGQEPPPCRAFVHLVDRSIPGQPAAYATALIFPAEYEDEIGNWLLAIDYQGGDLVEGGSSHVTNYYEAQKAILDRRQLWSRPSIASRSAEEVLASVRRVVQR